VLNRFLDLLNQRRDELAAIITSEHGKVLSDAQGEVMRGSTWWSLPAEFPSC